MEEKMKAFVEPVMADRPEPIQNPKEDQKEEVISSSSDESKMDKKVGLWRHLTKTIQVSLAELTRETIDAVVPPDE